MVEKLPKKVRSFINIYLNLHLNGKKVPCPYYINIKIAKQRMGLRVLIGKGTPEEIIQESLVYEKLRGVDFNKMNVQEIRDFMIKRHIGIDCSGFVVQVIDYWLQEKGKRHLWMYLKYPKQSLYRKIARFLRPVENISAEMLTNDENTIPIKNLNNICVGDLIRSKVPKRLSNLDDMNHVMLVSDTKCENGKVTSFKYVHSTRLYGEEHGVRTGEVIVKDAKRDLCYQEWKDVKDGKCWTKDEICSNREYSQVRRFKNVPLYE